MREFFKISALLFFAATSAFMLSGCNSVDDTNTSQREDIVEFLEEDHDPLLIAESEVSSSLDLDPPFYTVYPAYTYRYISTYYDSGRDSRAEVKSGSRVTMSFDFYEFTGSEIDEDDLPVYTNRASDEARLIEAGLNTELWDFTPMTLTIGGDNLLASIQLALIGCREGDEVEVYLTYNDAYGDNAIGAIEKESSIRFSCTIESVES